MVLQEELDITAQGTGHRAQGNLHLEPNNKQQATSNN
jgi:hypothetical protein